MFLPEQSVTHAQMREFMSTWEAMFSPVSKKLYSIEVMELAFSASVFINTSMIDAFSWRLLEADILGAF